MTALAFTFFRRLRDPQGHRVRATWPALLERLSTARSVADKHDAPGLSFATFREDRRSLANVERAFAIGLDLDELEDFSVAAERFGGTASFVHSTWSSTPEAPRARAFLLLSRPCSADEYRRVYACICGVCERGGLIVDRQTSDPSRFWFLPSTPPGGTYRYSVGRGKPIDVDRWLAVVPAPAAPVAQPPPAGDATADVLYRATAYLARCDPAVSGQGGHRHTFVIAQKIVRGFGLDEQTAYLLMAEWNRRCDPPWSEAELRRKIRQAAQHGRLPDGELRDRRRHA